MLYKVTISRRKLGRGRGEEELALCGGAREDKIFTYTNTQIETYDSMAAMKFETLGRQQIASHHSSSKMDVRP